MTKNTMILTLKAHEKMFLNGAVVRFDRKTKIELLNDARFLLEAHVIQAEETDTPLKQLYYAAQIMLIDPVEALEAEKLFFDMLNRLYRTTTNKTILNGLQDCLSLAKRGRIFDILKIIRSLFSLEADIIKKADESTSIEVKVPYKLPVIKQAVSQEIYFS